MAEVVSPAQVLPPTVPAAYQYMPADSLVWGTIAIKRTADNVLIAPDPQDQNWLDYVTWRQAGGIPDPLPPSALLEVPPVKLVPAWNPYVQIEERLDLLAASLAELSLALTVLQQLLAERLPPPPSPSP